MLGNFANTQKNNTNLNGIIFNKIFIDRKGFVEGEGGKWENASTSYEFSKQFHMLKKKDLIK